jgi:hypothetical protein
MSMSKNSQDVRLALPKLTDRLALGSTGLEVSPFCLGMSDPATVMAAFEAGINFFFITADMHWRHYEGTRRGLKLLLGNSKVARDRVVVAVCSYVTQPEFCWAPFEEVLEELPELTRADVNVAGGCYADEFFSTRIGIYRKHRRLEFTGARAIGATFHDRQAVLKSMEGKGVDIAFVRYNPSHAKARQEVFQHLRGRRRRRPLLFNFKSTYGFFGSEEDYARFGIGPKLWRPHVTDYYRFALSEPALDGILCSLPSPRSVRDLADALNKGPLDVAHQEYLIKLGALIEGAAKIVA